MIHKIKFNHHGEHEFKKFPPQIQKRIIEKLELISKSGNPLYFAKPLINIPPATHRFRAGKYRISFYIEMNSIVIDSIDTRGDAYRHR